MIERIAAMLDDASAPVILTGAGLSAESGVPTFRDAMIGLWSKYDPLQLATPEAFERDPELVTRWYDERRLRCAALKPNPAHQAIVELENRRGAIHITQNVDRLHARAGSHDAIELHGTLFVWRCTKTGEEIEPPLTPFETYPPPSAAGAPMRPAVVWFGEMLPERALERSFNALAACDLFLSIGTSALVQPAAGFIDLARENGAKTVEINADPTPISNHVDVCLQARAGEALPAIVNALKN